MWSKEKTNNSVDLSLVIISGIVFGAVPSSVTYCYAQGATAALVIMGRYSIRSAVMLPIALREGNLWKNGRKNIKKLLVLSSITWGTYITLLDKLKNTGLTSEQVVFFIGLFSAALTVLFGLLSGKLAVQVTPNGWVALVAVNILAAVCGSAFFAIGIRRTDA